MTPAENFATSSAGVVDTSGKQWEQYKPADNLQWTWRKKIIYVISIKNFFFLSYSTIQKLCSKYALKIVHLI